MPRSEHPFSSHAEVKKLISYIKEQGFVLVIAGERPIGSGGYFDLTEKEILVYSRDENGNYLSDAEFSFHLAHEVRHLQHYSLGIFASYYNYSYKSLIENNRWDPLNDDHWAQIPSQKESLAAENDCDQWAVRFLKEKMGLEYQHHDRYPCYALAHYQHIRGKKYDDKSGIRLLYRELLAEMNIFFANPYLNNKTTKNKINEYYHRLSVLYFLAHEHSVIAPYIAKKLKRLENLSDEDLNNEIILSAAA